MGPKAGRKPTKPGAGWISNQGSKCIRACTMAAAAALVLNPTTVLAADAGGSILPFDILMTLIVAAAGALAVAGGLWGLAEHRNTVALRESLRTTTAKARALLSARDAWLSAGRETLLGGGAGKSAPAGFRGGAALVGGGPPGPRWAAPSPPPRSAGANGPALTR